MNSASTFTLIAGDSPEHQCTHAGVMRSVEIGLRDGYKVERLTRRNCPGVTLVTVRNAIEKFDAALKPRRAAISFNGSSVSARDLRHQSQRRGRESIAMMLPA